MSPQRRPWRRSLSAAVIAALFVLVGAAPLAAAPPSNDNFAAAETLAAGGGTLTTSNVEATKEPGEPAHAGDAGGRSIWFKWTPSFDGWASVDTKGSGFDTLLAAYTGGSVSTLTPVASDDDVAEAAASSRVCFLAAAGSPVMIAVDGFDGVSGSITLTWGAKTDSAPCPILPPQISGPGSPKVGDVLVGTLGTFADAGHTFATHWSRCAGDACYAIADATTDSYVVTPRDVGMNVTFHVANSNGSAEARNNSAPTAAVSTAASTHPNGRIYWATNRDTVWTPPVSVNYETYSMFEDGGSLARLTNRAGFDTGAVPSPSGRLVFFLRDGELALMNADGSDVRGSGLQAGYPTWSPDGSRIAFARSAGGQFDAIGVLDSRGNVDTIRSFTAGDVRDLDWSPTGNQFAITYRFPGHTDFDVAVMAADGEGPITALTSSPIDDHSPAWSPTGDKIVFARGPVAGPITDGDLYVMDTDGGNQTLLVDGDAGHVVTSADWSPNGATIVFSRNDNGNSDLFTIPAAGETPRRLTTDGNRDEIPSWGALASFTLSVDTNGSGGGMVTSAPGGITCGLACEASFTDPTPVTLTANPDPGSTFVGWEGDCGGTGACVVAMTGDHSVTARFDATPQPQPPPPPPGGGGGGGGGGASVPDLAVTMSAKTTTPALNDADDIVVAVTNKGGAGALGTHLTIVLPGTMTLLGPPAHDRGSGCTGTQTLECDLDFVPNGVTTKVLFSVRVTGNGVGVLSASVTADRDANLADNSASLTLNVVTPPTTTPPTPRAPASTRGITRTGTNRSETLRGTARNDVLRGRGGNDVLYGLGGNDRLVGGRGHDRLLGGLGSDRLEAVDGERDVVSCGPGRDTAFVDRRDVVSGCEKVTRR